MAEPIMNTHDRVPTYDLFAGMSHDDMIERVEAPDEGLIAIRGDIQFQRPTREQMIGAAVQRLDKRIEDEQQVRVQLTVGDGGTDIGTFNIAHGSAGLATLLRQIADRLDP